MMSVDESGERIASGQMNAELRHAQLEMLSAQCATDRLRLQYSPEEMARHGQRDLLRKAWISANALFEYYNGIVSRMADGPAVEKYPLTAEEAKVLDSSERLARFMREQRDHLRPVGRPLDRESLQMFAPFFSREGLVQARTVIVDRERAPRPPLDATAGRLGATNLTEFLHPVTTAFQDVVILFEEPSARALFHGLVHTVQIEVLGVGPYAEYFVRELARGGSHGPAPLEAHATMLETAFAEHARPFSVEEKVRLWVNQGRY